MGILDIYESGSVLFATPDHSLAVNEAKEYCRENGLTFENVKILKVENMVIVKKR